MTEGAVPKNWTLLPRLINTGDRQALQKVLASSAELLNDVVKLKARLEFFMNPTCQVEW